ncbi:methyltransferase domain-containing protein [Roseisolibacter sp. H3M3-2]|uniref:class I SAM-dependent methyltransferase n=1 Tax=Roseisolibacter sp. H3M3-2 TaxID=3031323 RepID=UPI0023DAB95F|nr:methyltransferase domain-containing protein [Roseisolibacter sp. H3M3-2]MDF1505708.1 methyltransferase domain-containing protein [Roseisolibacter sp. H3M3-2]
MTTEDREYVLGTHDAELRRLGFQHQVWAGPTVAAWERAGFAPGQRLLDVGCGPGYATFDLADLVGERGHVLGVDVSQRFVAHLDAERARRGHANVEARLQDLAALDVAPASVDGAWARWVLCFVRDPAAVTARVARALRPGGAFVVMDYVHYEGFALAPGGGAAARVISAVAESFRRAGGDPNVGQSVPAHMRDAGLVVESVESVVRAARPGTALWEWPWSFFRNFLPGLVAAGGLSAEDHAAFEREWAARADDPAAFLLTPPMVVVVGRKPR